MQTTDRWFRTRPDSLDLDRPRSGECPRPNPLRLMPTGVRLLARRAVPAAGFATAVAHYEAVLQTSATVWAKPHPGTGACLAVVGELLVVGSDPLSTEREHAEYALITPSATARRVWPDAARADAGRAVATLRGGVRAEVWNDASL